jgi:predicted DNA-binding transcriptional regulator AlpA
MEVHMHTSNNKLFYRQRELTSKVLPFSATTLWRKVKSGEFPAPIKLGASITAWRASDVIDWIARQEEASCKR